MISNEKVKVSKGQFAEVLYCWLTEHLTKKAIKGRAKELEFKIRNDEEFSKIFEELFVLNMWLIVYTCAGEDKRNECLDVFHHLVYERHTDGIEEDFCKWKQLMTVKYLEYNSAMETEHPSTPLWVVASIVNKNLFGKIKKDPHIQMHIVNYIGLFMIHLGKLMTQYDVE